ncbi:hypothetical protein RB195_012310 [Necator americanus]|uniref:Zasp-like motif domain-containing protein n=1 Tax=Necator americanus TaxID=51031 RepID=A0ABR1D6H1_NECAM
MRVQSVYSPAGNTTYSEVTGTDGNNIRNSYKTLHRPGIEPGPPAWQASILPLNHRCVSKVSTALQETPHIQRSQEQMGTKKVKLHRPGIEPGPPAWQASILPLNHRCVSKVSTALQETPHIQRSQEQMGTTSNTFQSVYSPAGNTTYSEVTGTDGNKRLHRPGIEPGPPAWQASILPLNHRCVSKMSTALQETPHIQRSQEQMGTTSETRV